MSSQREIYTYSLKQLRDSLASGSISSLDAVNSFIGRIESENPKINSVISLKPDRARKLAQKADEHLKKTGKSLGPLHGVPFTIKDAFRAKDFNTSFGVPLLHFFTGKSNCEIVDRLEKAGAILLGQTNVPLSCFEWQTNSPAYGLTKNPRALDRTCGGSSGGSAATVASFMSPFEIGSDVAGSIRYPAHCCGVFGFRPTHNKIRFNDIGPAFHPSSFKNLACAGPVARSVEDIEIILEIISTFQAPDVSDRSFSFAYSKGWSGVEADKNSKEVIRSTLEELKSNGHKICDVDLEIDMQRAYHIWGIILGHEYKPMIPLALRYGPGLICFNWWFNRRQFKTGPLPDSFELGLKSSLLDYEKALSEADEIRKEFDKFMDNFDAWITPASPGPAISHQKPGKDQIIDGSSFDYTSYLGTFLCPTALFHNPILSIPIGNDPSSLPIGIQLHGKRDKDVELFEVAKSAFNFNNEGH